jgi:hypothetical protein
VVGILFEVSEMTTVYRVDERPEKSGTGIVRAEHAVIINRPVEDVFDVLEEDIDLDRLRSDQPASD